MKADKANLVSSAFLIFALALLAILPFLSYGAVFQVSEAREGVVVNEILATGELILPKRNGEIVPSKPILFHWIGASAAKLFGGYAEFELRLPSAIAAAMCVTAVFIFVAKFLGVLAASLAALVLLTCYGFYRMSCDGRVDMVMTCLVTLATLTWWSSYLATRKLGGRLADMPTSTYWSVGLFCGLACLAKGPIGIVLPIVAVVSITLVEEGPKAFTGLLRFGWVLAVLLPLPWYFMASIEGDGAFVQRQLLFENISRFIGGEGITEKPPWFYLVQFWTVAAPWSFVFAGLVVALFVGEGSSHRRQMVLLESDIKSQMIRGSLVWFLVGLFLFSLSVGKRRAYLVPLLPGLAIFLATYLYFVKEDIRKRLESERSQNILKCAGGILWISAVAVAVFASLCSFNVFELQLEGEGKFQLVVSQIGEVLGDSPFLITMTSLCLISFGALNWHKGLRRRCLRRLAIGGFCLLLFVHLVIVNSGVALKGETHSYRDFAFELSSRVPTSVELSFIKRRLDESFDGLFFYYKRRVRMLEPELVPQLPGLYLARRGWLEEQDTEFLAKVQEVYEGGRKTDERDERLILFKLLN